MEKQTSDGLDAASFVAQIMKCLYSRLSINSDKLTGKTDSIRVVTHPKVRPNQHKMV